MRTLSFFVFCFAVFTLGVCEGRAAEPIAAAKENQTHDKSAITSGKAIAPCELITKEEVAKIQGEAVTGTSPSVRTEGSFIVSQCYVSLTTSSNSVVINVTQASPGTEPQGPREFWKRTFHKDKEGEQAGEQGRKRGEREKEEREKAPPQKIEGVGEEAFWTGGAKAGALYVLSGEAFLRISLGGASDQESKITRSKQIAEIALKRL